MAFAMSAVVTGFNGPSCLPKNDPMLATMEDKDEEEYPDKTLDQRRHVTIIAAPSSPSVSSARYCRVNKLGHFHVGDKPLPRQFR